MPSIRLATSNSQIVFLPEDGLTRLGGGAALHRVLVKFLESKSQATQDIKTALANRKLRTASRLAHQMFSAAGTIGAPQLSATAFRLHVAIEAGVPETINSSLAQFETDCHAVMEIVQLYARRSPRKLGLASAG